MTIACIDVGYIDTAAGKTSARAACVTIQRWTDAEPSSQHVVHVPEVEPYEPGQFYRRELPCIRAVLAALSQPPATIVIDGYVWLGPNNEPGLGVYLHKAVGGKTPVIGVAKNRYQATTHAEELHRGTSDRPLFITAIGIPDQEAANHIAEMHGNHRIPTILHQADRLTRQ